MIGCDQTLSSEWHFLDAKHPEGEPQVISAREADHEYSVDHMGEYFYIRTNWDAENFRLMKTKVTATAKENWQDVVPHRGDIFLQSYELFDNRLVTRERVEGLSHIVIRNPDGSQDHDMQFKDSAYAAYVSATPDTATPWLRYFYTSMATPPSVIEYNMQTRERRVLKEEEILGGFDAKNYESQRLWAVARDGTRIPVSVLYRKDTAINGSTPCLVYGYGSYGSTMEPTFSSSRLNLVDRGFVYAIAHIRGGQEMGRYWYEQGKLLKKKKHVHGFRRCHRVPDPGRVCRPQANLCTWRQCRGPAYGRDRQYAAGPLPRDYCRRAVRGCRDHDVGRFDPAHDQRIRRMGEPQRARIL